MKTGTWKNKIAIQLVLILLLGTICLADVQNEDSIVNYLSNNNHLQGKAEIIFLLDRSGSVGAADFETEKGFVESFLTHVVVDANATRIAIISYSDTAVRHIDYLHEPKSKCFLSQEMMDVVYEDSGATNIVAALREARSVLENARPNVNKVIVLISDGLANKGGDPMPEAAKLKAEGVEIFCFGVGRFLQKELESLASSLQHVYTCNGFKEFKRLARKIRGDPHESSWSSQTLKPKCDHLCVSPYRGEPFDPGCCDHDARCSCALLSGTHTCVCNPGFYGLSGLAGDCTPCPRGTYKSKLEPATACTSCPPDSTTAEIGSKKLSDCYCNDGFAGDPSKNISCTRINCPPLQKPKNGYIVGNCDTTYGSTCHFMCEEGYELVDPSSDVRSCKSNGEWTETTVVCREIHCNPPPSLKNGKNIRCEPGPLTVGKKCKFECWHGYIKQGSDVRECLSSKNWSGIETKCFPVECDIPPTLQHGRSTCPWSQKLKLYETCAYVCNAGFELIGSKYLICRENGKLVDDNGKYIKPECKDVTPPVIICPRPIRVQAEKGRNTASVNWAVPQPRDNSGFTPKLMINPRNIRPNQQFPIGNTTFQYIAIDSVGLRSSCTVQIEVIDMEPPVILKCPSKREVSTNDVSAPVYWEEPVFRDNSGHIAKIYKSAQSGDIFGQGNSFVTYVAYDSSRNTAICEFEVIVSRTSCPYYPPPANGALVCSDWLYGQLCQTYCNSKFDFAWKPAEWYMCDIEAKWVTTPENQPVPWPDCSKRVIPGKVLQMYGFYYHGDCHEERVQMYIKKLFLSRVYTQIERAYLCSKKGSCAVNTVTVMCGAIRHDLKRRRRDVWEHAQKEQLELEFEITIKADQELNDTEAVLQDFLDTIRNLKWDFDEDFKPSTTTLSPIQVLFPETSADEPRKLIVTEEKTTLVCKPGSILANDLCVLCPEGTFYNSTVQDCTDCPVGYYQENEGQLECNKCSDGTNTEHPRSRNETSCKGICTPGTYSATGLETCLSCPVGTYQEDFGKDSCHKCPNGTTTESVGTVSEEVCKDICSPGTFSRNGLRPCEPCPIHHYQPLASQTECFECPNELSTTQTGAMDINQCINVDPCLSEESCLNNGICTRIGRNADCECAIGFEGPRCEVDIDECVYNPCFNEGYCINTEGSFYCNCSDGFAGDVCQTEIDECASNPCENNGTCMDKVNGYVCVCPKAYEGTNCELKRELCFRDIVCLNGGVCTFGDKENASFCLCEPGFSGIDCSYNINECENVICNNNGSCVDGIDSFTCACPVGYTGLYCETDIDECENNLCQSGSTCQDLVGNYKCVCPPGWNGTYCENKMNSDFILMFPETTATIANMATMTLNTPLQDATISLWVQTNDTERSGTPLSYAVASTSTTNADGTVVDNALTISDCSEVKIYVNNEPVVTDMQVADGQWHHMAFTWSSENSGKWALYKDGELKYEGKNLRPNDIINGGGKMIIGQEQDSLGGGFSPIETFTGNISRVNIWNKYFSKSSITRLCNMDDELPDKVLAWPDFLQGLRGDVHVLRDSTPSIG